MYLIICFLLLNSVSSSAETSQNKLFIFTIDDQIINPITANYLMRGIDRAESEKADAIIIQLDTPGGLMNSTHQIVRKILNTKVPIIVYIWPKGSRGGSAGVFITLASHVAAMAPATHIGAAHPVEMGGPSWMRKKIVEPKEPKKEGKREVKSEESDVLSEKITNDTVAWIRSMAKNRGRNEELAVKTVLESASLTETEALSQGLIEIVAVDLDDLLKQLQGREIALEKGKIAVLDLNRDEKVFVELSRREKILSTLTDPNIAYILMILGILGLIFEFTHPGIAFPGIGGAICLILAFVAVQTLPIDYGGLLLLALALALFIAEAFVTSFGLLAVGGMICMVLGAMMLIKSPFPAMQISWTIFTPIAVASGLITFFLVSVSVRAQRQKIKGGIEQLVGTVGMAETALNPRGKVFVEGEIWDAMSEKPVRKGESVKIIKVEGLKLFVQKQPVATGREE